MHPFIEYFLKANVLLIFFALFYLIFLKKETFYQLNRWYFIGSIVISIAAPLITFTKTVLVDPVPIDIVVTDEKTNIINEVVEEPSFLETIDIQQIAVYLILFISSVLLIRKMYAVSKLYCSIKKLPGFDDSNIKITTDNKTVYSFYRWIVVPENFLKWQNHQMILDHERIHLNQKHTFDLILIEIVAAVFWFNPLVKVMQRFINSNLEFIVDQKMTETTESVLYQKNLLQYQNCQLLPYVNSYNSSELKKRIIQLNTKKSIPMKKLKFLLATPVLIAFFALFQIETVAQVKETIEVQEIEETSFLVRENFTKEDFTKLTKELKQVFDIDFSVEKVKYNNNKIKSLDYTIRNKNYKISASETSLNKHIEPFLIVINLEESKPFKVEKYSAKPTYSYTVDNEVDPNFIITEDEWKNNGWINKISKNQKVVYLIDGKKSSKGAAYTLNPKDILSINVHRDQKTKDKFNETVDNVVIIKTKKIKDVTNLDKDLELLFSDRKAFDRIVAKYPIYVDNVLLTKKQLKNFDTKTIRSMYVEEDVKEIRLTTKTNETETFTFKIADDNSQSGKESTEEELTNHINKINQQKKDSLFSSNKIQIQKINDKDTHVTIKGIGSVSTRKIVYIVDGKEISNEDFGKIHPDDIERIDVLKDKKALEKYGDKAKDGVLLITTKPKKEVSRVEIARERAEKARQQALVNRAEAMDEREKAMKNRELVHKKREEVTQMRKKLLKERKQVELLKKQELEKQRQTQQSKQITVSGKHGNENLKNDMETLNSIFSDLKDVKKLEDENFKITRLSASITREDGSKVEIKEIY